MRLCCGAEAQQALRRKAHLHAFQNVNSHSCCVLSCDHLKSFVLSICRMGSSKSKPEVERDVLSKKIQMSDSSSGLHIIECTCPVLVSILLLPLGLDFCIVVRVPPHEALEVPV